MSGDPRRRVLERCEKESSRATTRRCPFLLFRRVVVAAVMSGLGMAREGNGGERWDGDTVSVELSEEVPEGEGQVSVG